MSLGCHREASLALGIPRNHFSACETAELSPTDGLTTIPNKEAHLRDFTHTELELLYLMSYGMDGEDAAPGAAQELRDLEAEGYSLPWAVL